MTITIQIGEDRREGVVMLTNAPRRYDYGYTIEIHDHTYFDECDGREPSDARMVLVTWPTHVKMQTERYRSGLYRTQTDIDAELYNPIHICETLWGRLDATRVTEGQPA